MMSPFVYTSASPVTPNDENVIPKTVGLLVQSTVATPALLKVRMAGNQQDVILDLSQLSVTSLLTILPLSVDKVYATTTNIADSDTGVTNPIYALY